MTDRGGRWSGVALSVWVLLLAAWSIAAGAQEKSAADVAAAVARTYNVTVLKTTRISADGKALYRLQVMAPPGNSNQAMQVTTLEIDAATGALVPQFRHGTTGYSLSGREPRGSHSEGADENMRRESLRH